ncbi:ankyrin repeat-containing protein BDA1-like [Salvia divinorum]|uniref:Ankyrin repeat-containing protein BDA1-like n=1 Tax=Salvia divinorum TaxID=28513 RepID=A0ABD1H8H6_SALDI
MELLRLLDQSKREEDDQKNQIQLKNLYEAAVNGSVQLLSQILKQNPQILLSPEISSTPENPLHAAALLGHLEFAKKLLSANPELSRSLSSNGSSALHLAAAKGDAEMVKELVSADSSMCGARDGEGRNPLHLAAIKGRTAVLEELLKADPAAAAALSGGGESCLHLCVKYNRVEAMKVILQFLERGDDRLVDWKDQNGNTVLHLAVEKKQLEIVEYLVDNTRIENEARNAAGLTALDLLLQNPGDLRDLEIKQCLDHQRKDSLTLNAASQSSKRSIKPPSSPHLSKLSTNMQPKKHKHTDWLGRKRSAVMIVASLTATVAFQAGLSPPGGVWQGDFSGNPNGTARADKAHKAGQSVMAYTLPDKYGQYMVFNTIAFLASLSIILLQVSGLPMRRRKWMWTQMVTMWVAMSAQTLTYFVTLINMTPKHVENTVYHVARVSVILWLVLMAVVFVGNMTRAVLYVMRKYGYLEEKEREVIVYEEEDDEL